MTQEDKDLFLTEQVTVNYVGIGVDQLNAIVNCVVFFNYVKEEKFIRVLVKEHKIKAKERLFTELRDIHIENTSEFKEFIVDFYKNNLEGIRLFA